MPTWLQILLACGGSVIITLLITEGFNWIKRHHQKNNILRDDQKQEELKQMIRDELAPIREDLVILKKGTQAVLRHDLYEMYDKWMKLGYAPSEEKVDFENIYQNYHHLGKNGVMDKMRDKFLALPDMPQTRED